MTTGLEGRTRNLNGRQPNPDGDYVLYWMTAARRPQWSHALDRAVAWAQELNKPLVILEALRLGYRWASDRHHAFIIDGMRANAEALAGLPVLYYPYLERTEGDGRGLLQALACRACVVVTDDTPMFFLPRMLDAATNQVHVRLEGVDGNGVVPLRNTNRLFTSAYHFRRYLQGCLSEWLDRAPAENPLAGSRLAPPDRLPPDIVARWPIAELPGGSAELVSRLPLDHSVGTTERIGGYPAAESTLRRFLESRLGRYDAERNQPGANVTSELSPYLHFGHISPYQIVAGVLDQSGWLADAVPDKPTGARQGWWGLDPSSEALLDQLITWRELGFNRCLLQPNHDRFETLPAWAIDTLTDHASDPRPHHYTLSEFEGGHTHDRLWNAAQTQLVRDGVIHNYLRMLWGKKILEWSASPREALEVMVQLNNRYALDGRDPNSYSGIMWVLGRFDRPWPERPVFGKVRSMSSRNTARKVNVRPYLDRYGAPRRRRPTALVT